MKPVDLILSLMPSAYSILELIRWLDSEGATSELSLYVSIDVSAHGMAEALVEGIHSEEATSILVERLCALRPLRAAEIRRDLTFDAIKQMREAEVEALVEQMHDSLRAHSALVECDNALLAIEERGELTASQVEALVVVRAAMRKALDAFVWST